MTEYSARKAKMISVVITTHDKYTKRLIEKAIPSVLNQTFQDFEIVVVQDGGSNILKKLPDDPRITYLHRQENFGNHTRPKNEGTMAAKGDLIAYLDADNAYRKEQMVSCFSDFVSCHNTLDMACHGRPGGLKYPLNTAMKGLRP